jgi:predicted nucleotidyltransferase
MTTTDVLAEMTRAIVDGFHPIRIILFGSRARGDARWDSDYDFLVVMPNGTDRKAVALAIRRSLKNVMAFKDVLVTTPAEIAERGAMPGSVLVPALSEGITLYKRT